MGLAAPYILVWFTAVTVSVAGVTVSVPAT